MSVRIRLSLIAIAAATPAAAQGLLGSFDYSLTASASNWWISPLSATPTIYNGIAIDLLSSGSFEDVTVDPSTNMDGFGSGNISFTADQIQVNWENLSFDSSTDVILDVTLGAGDPQDPPAAPEPATFLMLAPALACLPLRRRVN